MDISTVYGHIKAAMKEAGHVVSEGEAWTVHDAQQFGHFAHFTLGLTTQAAHEVLAFPGHFEAKLGHLVAGAKTELEKVDAGVKKVMTPEQPKPVVTQPKPEQPAPNAQPKSEQPAPSEQPKQPEPEQPKDEQPAPDVKNIFSATPQ
jgi:outer membrane biosynthesis protein TonB